MATDAPDGFVEFLDLHELDELHFLDHQLCDAHAAGDLDRSITVQVDQTDPDFPPVVRIHCAGCIDDAQALLRRQTRTRMDEADRAQGQGQADAGPDEPAFPSSRVTSSAE